MRSATTSHFEIRLDTYRYVSVRWRPHPQDEDKKGTSSRDRKTASTGARPLHTAAGRPRHHGCRTPHPTTAARHVLLACRRDVPGPAPARRSRLHHAERRQRAARLGHRRLHQPHGRAVIHWPPGENRPIQVTFDYSLGGRYTTAECQLGAHHACPGGLRLEGGYLDPDRRCSCVHGSCSCKPAQDRGLRADRSGPTPVSDGDGSWPPSAR